MMGDKASALLAELFHISPTDLRPQSRLAEDLGIDGDDARVFFAELRNRYGTDFTQLETSWGRYFRSEAEVWLDDINRLGIIALILLFVTAANWITQQVGPAVACIGCFARSPTKTPVLLEDVSYAVIMGRWTVRDCASVDEWRLRPPS